MERKLRINKDAHSRSKLKYVNAHAALQHYNDAWPLN